MFKANCKGDYNKTLNFLKRASKFSVDDILKKYGEKGVQALSQATPYDSGNTARSWYYTISKNKTSSTITFHNSNINNGCPIAIILQYGHGTGTGGWVEGIDYINPSIRPIFEAITNDAWKEVGRL